MGIFSAVYRVYWSETDAAIMMHFSNFFRACERAEEDFFASLGYTHKENGGKRILMPRVHAECDYKSILRPGDAYRVTITEIQLGKRSIRYFYEIYNETLERLSAICKIVTVFYDETSGKSVELPKELREKLLERGAKIVENYK
ncbi:MAG: acyl-CoA thioesterase [Caldisphaeraceae archaeon]|nr:acyl-CoA thioesterase [Caldisphaeraceae archaeon]MEB3691928.1 acyl-CoA thioesterase [Caldisphaeraceae archaeon]